MSLSGSHSSSHFHEIFIVDKWKAHDLCQMLMTEVHALQEQFTSSSLFIWVKAHEKSYICPYLPISLANSSQNLTGSSVTRVVTSMWGEGYLVVTSGHLASPSLDPINVKFGHYIFGSSLIRVHEIWPVVN